MVVRIANPRVRFGRIANPTELRPIILNNKCFDKTTLKKTCKVRQLFCRKISNTMKILLFIGMFLYVLSECGDSLFGKGGKSGKF